MPVANQTASVRTSAGRAPARKPAPASPTTKRTAGVKPRVIKPKVSSASKAAPKAATKSAAAPSEAKEEKPRKPKLVRDSFTIPKAEYAAIDTLKQRAMQGGLAVKKSELLRAGLMVLSNLTTAAFVVALQAVPAVKTGRPAKR